MKLFLIFFLILTATKIFAQHKNILISTANTPNEPSIMIDPANTNRIVAATNINNFYYSSDAGETWESGILSSSAFGVWGDPVIAVDTTGAFYFLHLSNPPSGTWIDRIVSQKSIDGGKTWNDGTAFGKDGSKAQDKQWAAVDRNTNSMYVTWTQFDEYGSSHSKHKSKIRFTRSTDGGETWSEPVAINEIDGNCIDDDETVEGAVPTVGPNGEIYVSWAGPAGLVFDKSLDGGETWLENDIFIDEMPDGWAYDIPGIMRANGMPITVCDLSGGPNHGNIYVNWSDQRNGTNDTDVWFSKSTDAGETWSKPARVNDDPAGKQQFFTWMDIDQTNGILYFVFYDRRNYDDLQTDVYMAKSDDGGETFVNFKISESPFIPNAGIFFGDYTNISAHNNVVRPIWTRLHNGALSVWTALIDVDNITAIQNDNNEIPQKNDLVSNYPNPFIDKTYLSFKLHKNAQISLKIYNVLGEEVASVIDNRNYGMGKYIESFSPAKLSLSTGTYYYILKKDGEIFKKKMLYIK
ncbi:MAG: T9SS C-terminal target domain-containing protein [Calditrichaeota bacterium]|nr:MAG: T9SS C-terminal target domain-containing protein [Calditrichota bacterium]MBL1207496.1 T9SS C-terminal target domain-containing protein [Calditrichota bacterium]NOG47328.1 T9SS type A sorting domain-containing protein [Calditrichota bacterium]